MNLSSVFEDDITLHDPNYFVAGNLHKYADRWQDIPDKDDQVLNWFNNKVDIHDFMIPFKGSFFFVENLMITHTCHQDISKMHPSVSNL